MVLTPFPVAPAPPVMHTGEVSSTESSEYVVTVLLHIYLPFSHAGASVCQPVVGAVVLLVDIA